jgi:hypothetical protein
MIRRFELNNGLFSRILYPLILQLILFRYITVVPARTKWPK